MMKERTLRVLEFTKILDMLASFAVTDMGREACEKLTPLSDLAQVNEALEETEEAQVILTYLGDSPLIGFPDVRPYLTLAAKGAALNPKALLSVAECLRASRAARSALVTDRDNTPRITGLASHLQTFRQLEDAITGAIISEEELSDHASPQLADIRRHIKQSNERVREKLNSMVHGASFSKYLQESIVTVRDGRYCIPVKQEYRQFVPGLVHDQSSTGATLFIEPMAVVELGNDLKQWKAKEREEIERILLELSGQVGAQSEMIEGNIYVLTRLDFIFAKGHLSREMNAVLPHMNDQGRIKLVRVRHPLIPSEKVVPCDLWLGQDFTTLIITGPNTGGKTVTLKTVGLLTLMAQAGLHVPGNLGTELSIFEQVYADIGDEQSIEQSLSTFSSHMVNIVSILDVCDRDTLVLFDELGAGTDPIEGAALAVAILEHVRSLGALVAATTHYAELKTYAMENERVRNASCEFDVDTLKPTYRLIIGLPGKSNAFAISQRLGIPASIIEEAKRCMSAERVQFEDMLSRLESAESTLEKEKRAAEKQRAEAERLLSETRRQLEAEREQAQRELKAAQDAAARILSNARESANYVFNELNELKKKQDRESLAKALEESRRSVKEALGSADIRLPDADETEDGYTPPRPFAHGDTVSVASLGGVQGTITRLEPPNAYVQAGAGNVKVKLADLRLVQGAKPKKEQKKASFTRANGNAAVRNELDLRGQYGDDAWFMADRFIDSAVMAGYETVTLIHGKGTGALRAALWQHLKNDRRVVSYRSGRYGEGDLGVTVCELKK